MTTSEDRGYRILARAMPEDPFREAGKITVLVRCTNCDAIVQYRAQIFSVSKQSNCPNCNTAHCYDKAHIYTGDKISLRELDTFKLELMRAPEVTNGTHTNALSFSPLLLKLTELESRVKSLEASQEALREALRAWGG